mgnify:CR=1 FL=1
MFKSYETELAGRKLVIETGKLAGLANGNVVVKYGDTVVMVNVTASKEPKEGIDFFPLSVDFEEKMYSVGKIPGSYTKREGKPSDKAILVSRAIDRPLRPLFPKDFRNDVVVVATVLCVEQDNSPEVAAMIGASAALSISDIPFGGPTAAVNVGLVNGEIVINPTEAQRKVSDLNLTVAGTAEKVAMIEAGANEVPDDVMLEAIKKGHEEIKKVCQFIQKMKDEIGKPKFAYKSFAVDHDLYEELEKDYTEKMKIAVQEIDKDTRDNNVAALTEEIENALAEKLGEEEFEKRKQEIGEAVYKLEKKCVRDMIFYEHKRVDGRAIDEIRPLSCEVGLLPRTHGSALFTRGQTQVMSIVTLGMKSEEQELDGIDTETAKRYMHQYNFPGYSVGEAKTSRGPGRREIGHGALAEKALVPVLPPVEEFPYAIRVVSEVLSSNGSTSQASICGSTLALMDAGVPIKRPVAGISTGLVTNPENPDDYVMLTDIQGLEDFFGDMDFKVTGTKNGITATQMDIKCDGLTYDILEKALLQAKEGREYILNKLTECIAEPRQDLKPNAPRIETMIIPKEFIGAVIGPGGKIIQGMQEETGATITIEEINGVGRIEIAGNNKKMIDDAMRLIKGIVAVPEIGEVYQGKVRSIMPYGAFVEFLPGKDGLLHISEIDWKRLETIEEAGLKEGDDIEVKLLDIDPKTGKFKLSHKVLLPKPEGMGEGNHAKRERKPQQSKEQK